MLNGPSAAESATQTETTNETAYTGGFTYYTSMAEDFANALRTTNAAGWWSNAKSLQSLYLPIIDFYSYKMVETGSFEAERLAASACADFDRS